MTSMFTAILIFIWAVITFFVLMSTIGNALSAGEIEGFDEGIKVFSVGMTFTTFWPLIIPFLLLLLALSPFYGIVVLYREGVENQKKERRSRASEIEKEYEAIQKEKRIESKDIENEFLVIKKELSVQEVEDEVP